MEVKTHLVRSGSGWREVRTVATELTLTDDGVLQCSTGTGMVRKQMPNALLPLFQHRSTVTVPCTYIISEDLRVIPSTAVLHDTLVTLDPAP